ncbi:phage DNA ejection protein [Serratia sp. MF2]|uniref:phage DNA ejection protein n=1 Tax=Serratia sp. MF2 TaxID=3059173 RepID=UPI0027EC6171|nr:phage DNA ejection protein [Serratia sp. MF2]MDQ7100891.1 phage DNA ejection protein [Serratia sp. MF2]
MATWQQGNAGGLLAGIGTNNVNAPRASDANTALSLIRDNNDRERAGENNLGMQLAGAAGSIFNSYKQGEQVQRQKAFQQQYANAFKSGDRNAMRDLAAQFPDQFEAVRNGMGFIDDDQRNTIGNLATRAQLASSQGQAAFGKYLVDNADDMKRVGLNPVDVAAMQQQDPKGFSDFAGNLALFSLGHDKYFDVLDKQQGRRLEQGRLDETVRSNQASEALQGQQIAVSRENSIRAAYAPTAAMQNYNQYAQMLKADPDAAAAFASSAGINTSAKKLMKVEKNDDGSVTKYYTDGSEEAGKLLQPISAEGIRPISLPQAQTILDKANEGTKKSAGFALRLKDSMDSMNQLSKTIDPKRVALINKSLGDGTIANMSLSPAEQQYMVNARDGLYAILRPETGAAITLPEMQEYSKMYLPQPGDSKEATETKMRKMRGQYNALRGQAGRAYDALVVSSAANSAQQGAADQASATGTHTSKSGITFTVK